MTTIVNLYGGPGTGKSTTAADLFALMKWMNVNVELVGEYAKDVTWEGRDHLFKDQLYLLAKQNRRLQRLVGKVDYVVTDSPLLLNKAYVPEDYFPETYKRFVDDLFDSYDNVNVFLKRDKPYHQVGRRQTETEARAIDDQVLGLLTDGGHEFHTVLADQLAKHAIVQLLEV